ncbi:MAG TPA: hypothetical protein VNX25_00830 [Verrucomicrobiae bacterium]|nr:hypothetical protein [Verrucomicrobiae bacterium]
MWFYDSEAGHFVIRSMALDTFGLFLNGRHLRDFGTPDEAVRAVAECRTGAAEWDSLCPIGRCRFLFNWVKSIW